ncbi:MAG: hypothetical protein J6V32_00040 [Elusimicrobiaceae bacterium]|nr:hypothetical protein [Elusimicrobiaceae bacterium]
MTKEKLIVALDVGTSGCRACAVRKDGTPVASYQVSLTPNRPREGTSQYEASDILRSATTALNSVLDKIGPQQAATLAVCSQRSTVVLWNKNSGAAAGPVLTWEDGRAYPQAEAAPISQEEVHALTGLYKTPFFSAPKIAWSLKNFPQATAWLKQKCLCAAPVASYLIWHLTKGKIFAADYSLAQRTLLFDIHQLSWSDPLCNAFGIPKDILPAVQPSAGNYGVYTYQGVDIPISVCVGDQQAAAAYFTLKPQQSLINYGTGAFWLYHAGAAPVLLPGMLTSVSAGETPQKTDYYLEGPVNSAASALMWLKAQGICFEDNETDLLCQASQNPLLFLPAFGGLGAPYWDFSLTPAVKGLSPHTSKPDWVAGVVRGIAFLLTDIAAYLRQNGLSLQGVRASGGLTHVTYLTRFQADLLQLPLEISNQAEATLLGACYLAAGRLYTGCVFTHDYTPVSPSITNEQAQALHRAWQEFVSEVRKR